MMTTATTTQTTVTTINSSVNVCVCVCMCLPVYAKINVTANNTGTLVENRGCEAPLDRILLFELFHFY